MREQTEQGSFQLMGFTPQVRGIFVRHGIARITTMSGALTIDEPLFIAAIQSWLNVRPNFSRYQRLLSNVTRNQPSSENGFEVYLTFYMRHMFTNPATLDSIFTLRKDFAVCPDLAWWRDKFELVVVSRGVYGSGHQISVVTSSSGPSVSIGLQSTSDEDVLEWISTNKRQFTFCFPTKAMGPDILFFIRSCATQRLLLVAVQAKMQEDISKETLLYGIRTVTPCWFWKSHDLKHKKVEDAPLLNTKSADDIEKALRSIPNGQLVEGANYPVIRVFASWPGKTRLERSAKGSKSNAKDLDKHPLASLNEDRFAMLSRSIDEKVHQERVNSELALGSKRHRDDESKDIRKRTDRKSVV